MQSSTSDPEARLKARALALGFDAAGIARADEAIWAPGARLKEFVALGRHGEMAWMETTLERRSAPTAMWPGARSALVVAMNYGPDHNPLDTLSETETGNISVYARGRDYHDIIKSRLKQLAGEVAQITGAEVKVFVDTAPLMEKPLAQRAGLGWQGRHTNLVSRDLGSWFFLGTVLTSAELTPDPEGADHCGSCRACLDICPTNAFPAPYQLDARRCISYLTIEYGGPIPAEFRAPMGNRIYGCDDCLAACPWNKFAAHASESALFARAELKGPGLDELAALDDATFREVFSGSPVKRSGRDRFVRNVCIAIGNSGGNSGQGRLVASLLPLLGDASPLVRGAAIWALARLDPARFAEEKARRQPSEHDRTVTAEWDETPA
ncbi:tRNA epoxyqueuosine(34) reductase QueG [Hyphomonas sp. WL0036]|uniref:tRNA epoxyqueuosine(34) reductase QueG n=1 Tax=Hyphomonas sediminis TaxID=2866160 RepID=UPI001C808FEA|nr:tRNA epoxyqueuosine(34) reductase QueG [Hyphomonas sediminis]MBY9066457.1 tRNA epoxyqueuosine(34) reductase QueG [Hyphomonas sediminis]